MMKCAFCDGLHYADQCRTVTDVKKRKDILKKKKRCFLCTRPGHPLNECTCKRNCFRCKGRHHTSICDSPHPKNVKKKEEEEPEDKKEDSKKMATFQQLLSTNKK